MKSFILISNRGSAYKNEILPHTQQPGLNVVTQHRGCAAAGPLPTAGTVERRLVLASKGGCTPVRPSNASTAAVSNLLVTRGRLAPSPAAHLLLCGQVPNRPRTVGPGPGGWGPLLY